LAAFVAPDLYLDKTSLGNLSGSLFTASTTGIRAGLVET